jgi:cytoskeleton protein RodZ
MPPDFGTKLREARERRGVSLRQIANSTKISMGALEALERNDVARLPGGIFTRAFVRAYAGEVGLDPEQTIREFMAQFPHDSVTVGHPASARADEDNSFEANRGIRSAFVKLLAISIPAAIAVFYLGIVDRQVPTSGTRPSTAPATDRSVAPSRATDAVVALPEVAAPGVAPSRAVPASVSTAGNEAPAEATAGSSPGSPGDLSTAPLSVVLSSSGRCWVSVSVDGQRAMQRELQAGESHTFDAQQTFVITAGNAGALALTLNGAPARPLGRLGQVVTARMNVNNFKDYLAAR